MLRKRMCKNIFLGICLALILSSCRTIDFEEVRRVKEVGGIKIPLLSIKYIDVNDDTPDYWHQGGGDQYNSQLEDTCATVFYEELEKNIMSPYGAPKGVIELRNNTVLSPNVTWSVVSYFTLGIPNLLGMPYVSGTMYSNLSLRILDRNGKLVKQYRSFAVDKEYVAMWWGYTYSPDQIEAFKVRTFRKALKDILVQIRRDQFILNRQLQ